MFSVVHTIAIRYHRCLSINMPIKPPVRDFVHGTQRALAAIIGEFIFF